MIKRNEQLKKKQQIQPAVARNQVAFNKAYLKPSLFQFPQLMNKTTTFADSIRFQGQIPQAYTPDTQVRIAQIQPRAIEQPKFKVNHGVQRFSAKLVSKQTNEQQGSEKILAEFTTKHNQSSQFQQHKNDKAGTTISKQQFSIKQQRINDPIIVKITTTKNNHSQVINQLEEQSEYQLSELETFDELVQQIQEKVASQNQNINQLSHELCQLEAIDLKGLPFISQLIKHLIISSVKQQIHIPQILAILFNLVEEILMRDDLEVSLLEIIKVYLSKGYETYLSMIVVFMKRCGQIIYYIRNDKFSLFAELIVLLLLKFDEKSEIDKEQLELTLNILLRHKQFRLLVKENTLLKQLHASYIISQLERFKINQK